MKLPQDTEIENLTEDNKRLADRERSDEFCVNKLTNELQQYGRRNSICISGLNGDTNRQSSEKTTELPVMKMMSHTV